MRAAILGDKQPRDLALDVRGHKHRARLSRGLDARGDIGRVAEDFTRRVDYDRPGVQPDPRGKLGRALACVPGVEVGERALNGERGAHRAFGVVLLRLRVAKERHQPVAELLQHMAAQTGHRCLCFVEVGADEIVPIFRVETGRKASRTDEIAEHDSDRAALSRDLTTLVRR